MSTYTSINLAARPTPGPITADLFQVEHKDIPSAGPGQVLVKQTHMSLDPAMIGWMSPDPESYIPPVAIGEVMRSSGIGEVIESNHRTLPLVTASGECLAGQSTSSVVLKV